LQKIFIGGQLCRRIFGERERESLRLFAEDKRNKKLFLGQFAEGFFGDRESEPKIKGIKNKKIKLKG
jgi:hypothetical protein